MAGIRIMSFQGRKVKVVGDQIEELTEVERVLVDGPITDALLSELEAKVREAQSLLDLARQLRAGPGADEPVARRRLIDFGSAKIGSFVMGDTVVGDSIKTTVVLADVRQRNG